MNDMKHACRLVLLGALVFPASQAAAQFASTDGRLDPASRLRQPVVYPQEAIDKCVSGTTVIIVDVDGEGRFVRAVVEKSSRDRHLDNAALEAARHWVYIPPRNEKGETEADRIRIPLDFEEHESCWTKTVPDAPAYPEASSLERYPPQWPGTIEANQLSGEVVVTLLLESDGSAHSVRIAKSSGDMAIDQAARWAASQWTYVPAVVDGKPVRSVLRLPIAYGNKPK
ncbi:Ferric siderophore transport system, periplasmic binding protein TonB [Lysobacter capsici AZ78]|uniref:Ferric siderophore transport system, periplasmic binding protein TonB n=2 Tax=Lysobacter capsici TaxID=435897 RepID=A0A125TZT8_9GAMM|nr:Ferric siderophore transport system, periplasmic binding protein TonB [Lysobacter capsici AZ78]